MAQSNGSDGMVKGSNSSTLMVWSTARSNDFNSAQLSKLTQFVAANFRRLVLIRADSDWADSCGSVFVSLSSSI
ncbi:hypothetical protein PanWU01x14_031440 [Parasponia andersonii]|uniref:Uncharacterized protein n=1 Tax=Parasponia andersonii TaxID=3476 RepID=A0A2P5DU61_PARAD|nr:hypothetical protein PanWU01x14_031440 [Parasponia andersonii]